MGELLVLICLGVVGLFILRDFLPRDESDSVSPDCWMRASKQAEVERAAWEAVLKQAKPPLRWNVKKAS